MMFWEETEELKANGGSHTTDLRLRVFGTSAKADWMKSYFSFLLAWFAFAGVGRY